MKLAAALSGLLLLVFAIGASFAPTKGLWMTAWLAFMQDLPLTALLVVVVAIGVAAQRWTPAHLDLSPRAVILIALATFALCYAGHYLVLLGHELQRDEQMVTFDAWVYGHGRLAWPLPPEWRPEAAALNLMFMTEVAEPVAWISSYLPGNAMLHALFAQAGDRAFTAPAMTALALVLTWSCARKLWPDDREAAAVVLILLATAGQVLVHGMSLYAMSAHLACNMAWLRLFLNDDRKADMAALAIGFFATGLHQPLFHPLFVTPFMLLLMLERRWSRLVLFGAGYLAICLFWTAWPERIHLLISGGAPTVPARDFLTALQDAWKDNADHVPVMAANLLRFMTWQHVALLPLALVAWPVVRRRRMAAVLALGVILPVVVIGIILPFQGDGFGYRYLHPVLGNAALVAGYGWRSLAPLHRQLRGPLLATTIAMLGLVLPAQLWMSRAHYAPYARASARIDATGADYAIVNNYSLAFNRPDLSNRPIRLIGPKVRNPAMLAARMCRKGSALIITDVGFFDRMKDEFGIKRPPSNSSAPSAKGLRETYEALGCRPMMLN